MSLTLKELAALGAEELLALAERGELAPRHLWVAAKGQSRYLKAIATGDIAADVEQVMRAGKCARCPIATVTKVVGGKMDGVEKLWCGTPMDEHQDSGGCGCLVALRINGEIAPAAKPAVDSEQCPLGEW